MMHSRLVGGPHSCNTWRRTAGSVLRFNKHEGCKDTRRASRLGWSTALFSTEQTLWMVGMFSGCYCVLCRNEIASHLYHHPQTLKGPLTIAGTRTTGLPGDTNQLAVWKKKLPGNWKCCKENDWQEIGRSLCLSSLTLPRESTFSLEGRFAVAIWTQDAECLNKMVYIIWGAVVLWALIPYENRHMKKEKKNI